MAGGVNLYSYAGNNPISFSDPFGLCHKLQWGNCTQMDMGREAAYSPDGGLTTVIVRHDGMEERRRGGDPNWRNNNPGNMGDSRFARSHGSIGESGRWAVFSNRQDGYDASLSNLQSSRYRTLTLDSAIATWAPASDGNNVPAYQSFVAHRTGLNHIGVMGNFSDSETRSILDAIAVHEGSSVGTVTYQRP